MDGPSKCQEWVFRQLSWVFGDTPITAAPTIRVITLVVIRVIRSTMAVWQRELPRISKGYSKPVGGFPLAMVNQRMSLYKCEYKYTVRVGPSPRPKGVPKGQDYLIRAGLKGADRYPTSKAEGWKRALGSAHALPPGTSLALIFQRTGSTVAVHQTYIYRPQQSWGTYCAGTLILGSYDPDNIGPTRAKSGHMMSPTVAKSAELLDFIKNELGGVYETDRGVRGSARAWE
ncbi:hypothetical protein EDC04DRAFT_2605732 [Pisolithus marmoratus]|nr:hypothetical protein EDC04DRAFT_2605732 [Pisolithus marmoratus]